jgi:hypothetical protein
MMTRFFTQGVLALAATAVCVLPLGASPATAEVGMQNVALSCNDGTDLALALAPADLTQLSNAVAAINLYPAGDPPLACSLTQSNAAPSSSSGANGPHDFVVGGGQLPTSCGLMNFSISAHVANDAPVAPGQEGIGGTYNNSVGATSPCGHGSFTSKVDCLQVAGNTAQWTFNITHAKGPSFFGFPGAEGASGAKDNTPDELTREGGLETLSGPCNFFNAASNTTPLARGNIDVHDA